MSYPVCINDLTAVILLRVVRGSDDDAGCLQSMTLSHQVKFDSSQERIHTLAAVSCSTRSQHSDTIHDRI